MKKFTKLAGLIAATLPMAAIATPAHAAESVWDKVAFCESTNDWDINTGNGFYGGLQFTISTWDAFGGREFASRADLATKAEQITVAQRTLAVQGPGAWPKCSVYAGLTKENGGAVPFGFDDDEAPATKAAPAKPATPAPQRATPRRAIPADPATRATPARRALVEHTVVKGDTLIQIARDHGLREDWQAVYLLNESEIENPDLIYVGQRFLIEG